MSKKIINTLFHYASSKEVDSITVESERDKVAFNYHFPDGEKHSFGLPKKLEKDLMDNLRQVLKVNSGELVTKKYCKIHDKNYKLTFYLTILPNKSGEKMVINIIKRKQNLWRMKQLGLQRYHLKTLEKNLKICSGLIIISSPQGEGRSTTLYSLLQELNNPKLNIYLLSNYPEYQIEGINQLEPNETNWDLILKHDSDVIALDDNESDETLTRAFRAASSGRLVILSLTAKSSWEVLLRILKLKIPLDLKLNSLKLIINQRTTKLLRAKNKKDVSRREIGLFEILELSPEMKDFILAARDDPKKEKFWEQLVKMALNDNFIPLTEDVKIKIKDGLLDPEDYS